MGFDGFCQDDLWNWTQTWNPPPDTAPDLSFCFEQTVLSYVPCGFLLLLTPYDIYNSIRSGKQGNFIPWSTSFALSKTILNTGLIALQLQLLGWLLSTDETVYYSQVVQVSVRTLAFILVSCLVHFSRSKGVCSSGPQFLFWFLMAACEAFAFRTSILHADWMPMYPFILSLIFYPLVIVQLILSCWADTPLDKGHMNRKKGVEGKKPCPEQYASFISKIVFSWFDGLGFKGYRRPLEDKDLWDLNPEDKSDAWYPLFDKYWGRSVEKSKQKRSSPSAAPTDAEKKPVSILGTLIRVFGPSFALGAFMKLVHDLLIFVQPEILDLLIAHVQNDEETWKGYVYTGLLFASAVVQTLFLGQYFHQNFLIGMRMRSTLVSVIYRKALVMSNTARKESTVGEIVNLMSVDAQRFMDSMPYLNMIWSAPLQMALCLYFLWQTLGPSVLAGLAVMILLIPVNGFIVSKVRTLQIAQMKNKDERVKLMNEVLSGIKVLKLYAWEPSFHDQIMEIRGREIKLLKKSAYLFSFVAFIWTCTPFLVSVVTFATYVLIDRDNVLDARKAFVSTTLFNIMRAPLAMLPVVITGLVQTSVSLKRINKFMNSEEIDPKAITHTEAAEDPIQLDDASFSWDGPTAEPNLKHINLRIKEGSLTAVVGAVGSGKSTLLASILGELEKLGGKVNTRGSVAYVAQVAWIQNDTLRNNVLFGKSMDTSKYEGVIESCALGPDLEILTAGDQTEIGEKGINLSGGQKQRVSLARAAYNNADIYLLDDPLSAVDSHVGLHIFDNVIGPQGLLQGKTRVLVTHGITFLPQTDRIIVLKDGEISEEGTYAELLQRKGAFAEFLVQHLGSVEEGEELGEDAATILRDLQGVGVIGDSEARELTRQMSRQSIPGDKGKELERQTSAMSLRERKSSKSSISGSLKKSEPVKEKKEKLIEVEKAQTGSVKIGVYVHYMKSISWTLTILTLGLHILNQAFAVYANIWLTRWSNESKNSSTIETSTQNMYLGVYGALGVGQAVAILLGSLAIALGTLYASSFLHLDMLKRVLRSPMSFFDTTPTGRVVNRFAKDVDTCDNVLPQNLRSLLTCFLSVVSTIGVISYSTPIFMSVILPTGIVYYLVQRFYVATSRQLKRLESISRSPIYSHFSETLTGTTTIRAYSVQPTFIKASEAKVDYNQSAYFPSIVSNRWLAVRLETVGNLLILFAALFAVMLSDDPGLAGLSISYALQITQTLNWLVRMTSDVETNIVAVERIKEYCEIEQEAEWEVADPKMKPPPQWPALGEVKFQKYATRYREGMDLVLRDVTCQIRPSEKVGIVGRTGAGKSSLTLGLFRIIEAAGGFIEIDGQNISKLGLHDVRGKITIIPQDPVLFSGTLRLNLDPFAKYSDDALWNALEHAHLKTFVQSVANGLEYEVNEGGENLSVGQRQLICLARALLRKTKILVLDEATAAIDLETDDLIQQTIRSEFRDCTVLTIAHRLNTIMDSTRVLVLDRGEIREFDAPAVLLADKNSIFYGMAKDAGLA